MPLEDIKSALSQYFDKYVDVEGSHIFLPDYIVDKISINCRLRTPDEFGCNARFDWLKELGIIKGKTLVDIAGSSGFFSLRAIYEGLVTSSTVYDINETALTVGEYSAELLGIKNRISFINKPVDIKALHMLADADVVFCLNLLHHAGIHFDQERVSEIGWQKYAVEFLSELRKKYKISVISLAFKGTYKPINLQIPFHQFEGYFKDKLLKEAGWVCVGSGCVGTLKKRKNILVKKTSDVISELIWYLTSHWILTRKIGELTGQIGPGKLGSYFIFVSK